MATSEAGPAAEFRNRVQMGLTRAGTLLGPWSERDLWGKRQGPERKRRLRARGVGSGRSPPEAPTAGIPAPPNLLSHGTG